MALILFLGWGQATWAERAIPPLSGPVVDQAAMLRPDERERLGRLSQSVRAAKEGNGVQLQFLIVPSLDGEPIESFAMRVAERWKLGSRGQDNGVLFVASRDDRRMRIEVGGGLEGGLTDAQAGRIIREVVAPAFRDGRYGEGLFDGAQEALAALDALPQGTPRRTAPRGTGGGSLFFFGFLGLWLLFSVLGGAGRRRRSAWWMGPGMGGGGFGGSGGGSWGGGGGGFSGGGASGNW